MKNITWTFNKNRYKGLKIMNANWYKLPFKLGWMDPPLIQKCVETNMNCLIEIKRGCSSNGRALALHARGTGFDPLHLHFCFFFAWMEYSAKTILCSGRHCYNWRAEEIPTAKWIGEAEDFSLFPCENMNSVQRSEDIHEGI